MVTGPSPDLEEVLDLILDNARQVITTAITLLSFDLWRNYHVKNVVLSEENSILLLSERLESSGW